MKRHTPVLMLLSVVTACAMAACAPARSDASLEATVVAKVMATISYQQTAAVPPTSTPVPSPTITPTPADTPVPPPVLQAREYEVLAAMVELDPVGFDLSPMFALRAQTTADLSQFDFGMQRKPDLPPGLEASYRSRNAQSYPIVRELDIAIEHQLMPESDWQYVFQGQGSQRGKLQERYPEASGALMFSRVGFSDEGDQALVSMGVRCGDLCGMGGIYWLERVHGAWAVKQSLVVWES